MEPPQLPKLDVSEPLQWKTDVERLLGNIVTLAYRLLETTTGMTGTLKKLAEIEKHHATRMEEMSKEIETLRALVAKLTESNQK